MATTTTNGEKKMTTTKTKNFNGRNYAADASFVYEGVETTIYHTIAIAGVIGVGAVIEIVDLDSGLIVTTTYYPVPFAAQAAFHLLVEYSDNIPAGTFVTV